MFENTTHIKVAAHVRYWEDATVYGKAEEDDNPIIFGAEGNTWRVSIRLKDGVIENVERNGNGAHIWSIHHLVKLGLMDLTPVPALLNIKAYRLNSLGKSVRAAL